MLEPAQRGLAGQIGSRIERRPACCQLEGRVAAQLRSIVRILVASHDPLDALAQQVEVLMVDEHRVARIGEQWRQTCGQAELIIDGSDERDTRIGGQLARVEGREDLLAGRRRDGEERGGILHTIAGTLVGL